MNADVRELYQQLIIDHGRHPRHTGCLDNPTHAAKGYNPLCGDKISMTLRVDCNVITDILFEGEGCAISQASSSLMAGFLTGKTVAEAEALFNLFQTMVTTDGDSEEFERLGKCFVLAGVKEFPMRVKCATLAWHTLINALHSDAVVAVTE